MILGASRYIPIRNVSPRNGFPLEDISPYRPAWPAVHKLPSSKSIHHWDKKDAGDSFVPVRVTQVCWYMRSRPNKVAVHQVCSHGKENDISSKSFSDAITGQENKNAACVCLSLSLFFFSHPHLMTTKRESDTDSFCASPSPLARQVTSPNI